MKILHVLVGLVNAGLVNAGLYQDCNMSQAQYFGNERIAFGVDERQTPFENSYYGNISHFPTTCINDDGIVVRRTDVGRFIQESVDIDKRERPVHNLRFFPSRLLNHITNGIWHVMGFSLIEYQNETFWYYENPNTNNTIMFFHGINAMNGIENLYLLQPLKSESSIYVSIYSPTFIGDYFYNNTYSQHITNIIAFIENVLTDKRITILGNSYGSIRSTSLCKQYDCSGMSSIILTDPVNINFPFSKIFACIFHGAIVRTDQTEEYRQLVTVQVMRKTKHFVHAMHNLDWFEWTIDTAFMQKYKNNLILVIGTNDELMSLNATSVAMTQICRVIYTNTKHGFVLFTKFMNQIQPFEGVEPDL